MLILRDIGKKKTILVKLNAGNTMPHTLETNYHFSWRYVYVVVLLCTYLQLINICQINAQVAQDERLRPQVRVKSRDDHEINTRVACEVNVTLQNQIC